MTPLDILIWLIIAILSIWLAIQVFAVLVVVLAVLFGEKKRK